MPPEYAAYQLSPHARVACVECHIGREFIGNQIFRKAGDLRHVIAVTFNTYEYPIRAENMRPAPDICEKCHTPEKFSDDSLRVKYRFQPDENNDPYNIYLILKTGGGSKRAGLGRGIHWHIENPVYYYATDHLDQEIPFIRVVNDDGTTTEYVDIESGFNPASLDEAELKQMDCITCHNRITHLVYQPEDSVDNALARGAISTEIPEIRLKGVEVLRGSYISDQEALVGIAGLENYYSAYYPDFYAENKQLIADAISELQSIYADSVFPDQKVDWDTHPNNVGHINSPGCFRCHDGKHLDSEQQAIRLECNLCHSIPIVSTAQDFLVDIEISRGPEPESHQSPNWIAMHREVFDYTCENCHTTDDAGGTSNTSFCSNSACHGSVFTYAGFDAPALREILQAQLPPAPPAPGEFSIEGEPTFEALLPLFQAKCTVCHGDTPSAGLNLSTYETALAGGDDGAVIVPGDSTASKLVEVQSGAHFATFSTNELSIVKQWIDAGAPEK